MDREKKARTRPKWLAWLTSTQSQISLFFIAQSHSEGTVHLKKFLKIPLLPPPPYWWKVFWIAFFWGWTFPSRKWNLLTLRKKGPKNLSNSLNTQYLAVIECTSVRSVQDWCDITGLAPSCWFWSGFLVTSVKQSNWKKSVEEVSMCADILMRITLPCALTSSKSSQCALQTAGVPV